MNKNESFKKICMHPILQYVKLIDSHQNFHCLGPDEVNPPTLKNCARELTLPLTILFQELPGTDARANILQSNLQL